MARFVGVPAGIEVIGRSFVSLLDASGPYAGVVRKICARHGIKDFKHDGWHPVEAFLGSFRDLAKEVGDATLLSIGKKIPEYALWPPGVNDVEGAIRAIDVAYHMNHRLNGVPMFDPATGAMTEGLGHYRSERVGKRRIIAVSDTPYPSEFDRGILLGAARSFEPAVEVVRDEDKPTRRSGGDACTYVVTW